METYEEVSVTHNASSETIADQVCRSQGHNIVMFHGGTHWWEQWTWQMCTKCGLDLDEIRRGLAFR